MRLREGFKAESRRGNAEVGQPGDPPRRHDAPARCPRPLIETLRLAFVRVLHDRDAAVRKGTAFQNWRPAKRVANQPRLSNPGRSEDLDPTRTTGLAGQRIRRVTTPDQLSRNAPRDHDQTLVHIVSQSESVETL